MSNWRKFGSRGSLAGGAILTALAVAFFVAGSPQPVDGAADGDGVAMLREMSDTFAEISEKASKSVVFIEAEQRIQPRRMRSPQSQLLPEELFERFFGGPAPQFRGPGGGFPAPRLRMGQGSGFITSADGYIVTNHHVVGEADTVRVTLTDGRRFDAELVGTDPQTEIAILKINAENLPVAELGDSDDLRVGEWVLAIGSPFGLSHTVTQGIVSATGRGVGITELPDFIQTDAAINPGNSGGPLVNLDGEVVGVNTAIMSASGSSSGVGFAVPVNVAKFVQKQLVEHGSITRGSLGVWIQDITPELSEWFDVNDGVLIGEVNEGSPAEKAGLQKDDIVVEYNGKPVRDMNAFRSRVAATTPGEKATLTIIRDGERIEKTVTMGGRETKVARAEAMPDVDAQMGVTVQNLTDDIAQQLGLEGESGVVITEVQPGSPAAAMNLRPGALIKEVNRQPVNNVREFRAVLQEADKSKSILLLVKEGDTSRYVALRRG